MSIGTFAATWVVEQMPGGSVTARDGSILIRDAAGCTVWLRRKLAAPVSIAYEAKVSGSPRVSDMNCFWMAADPEPLTEGWFGFRTVLSMIEIRSLKIAF